MKKNMLILAFILFAGFSLRAQIPIEDSKVLKQEEVPAAVQQSFEKEFGTLAAGMPAGTWTVYYEENGVGKDVTFHPTSYEYRINKKSVKAVANFSPGGALLNSKGWGNDAPKKEPSSQTK